MGRLWVLFTLVGCETETNVCENYEGAAPREELALSPRADAAAEALALCIDGGLVATTATYERVAADLPTLRGLLNQSPTGYAWYGDHGPSALTVCTVDPADWPAIEGGTYTGWDCPNEWYGGVVTQQFASVQCAEIAFTPLLDPRKLVEEYAALPGLGYAEPKSVDGDQPQWRAVMEGSTVHYVFDDRQGDCPAGCTYGTAYYLRSDTPGQATLVDQWEWGYGTSEPPSWVTLYNRCE